MEDNKRITYIYGLYEVGKEDEIRYVGKTLNTKDRLRCHLKRNRSNKEKDNWINSVIQNGGEIKIRILEECLDNWSERESYWINKYGLENLTNILTGGQSGKYYKITYDEFKNWVRENLPQVKTLREWRDCINSRLIPDYIPKYPGRVYPQMKNLGEVFGTGKVHNIELTKDYLSYDEAKKYIEKFNFKSGEDWFRRYGDVNANLLPKKPHRFYKKRGWLGWGDFLGTGNLKNSEKRKIYVSYEECKLFAKENNINTQKKWFSFKNKPINIPRSPSSIYTDYWISWNEFFDRSDRNIKFDYLSYDDAKEFLNKLGIKNYTEYKDFTKGKTKEYRLHSRPNEYYKEWVGWNDYLIK